ncbi:MAG: 16S rRNA (guanine(527)-N(7))-methyltransferase RsmG [Rhodospirillales bacterium]|nr:16S rRNA (guanine(527)-N(7))-methyltransferase RsmG [Rhodospirillales bacterium]
MDQRLGDFSLSPSVQRRLELFADLLTIWNARINLVSRGDLEKLWSRHIADSLQLIPLMPENLSSAIDLGSGAGFPGLVLAIATGVPFTLIEADQRKSAFLTEAARKTKAPTCVQTVQIERANLAPARLVTARALAPLPVLLSLAAPFLAPDGVALFPKGKNAAAELTAAARQWHMRVLRLPSRTDPQASVLRVSEIRRVRANP